MKSLRLAFITILACNAACFLFLLLAGLNGEYDHRILQESPSSITSSTRSNTHLGFIDSIDAYYILRELDLHKPLTNNTPTEVISYGKSYNKYHFGLTQDKQYCEKHRAYFVNNAPYFLGDKIKIFSDHSSGALIRRYVFQNIGEDVQPKIGPHIDDSIKKTHIYDIRTDTQMFFCNALYWAREIGTEFSCLTQMSNHIPGHALLYRKDYAAEALIEYRKNYTTRPHCFDYNKFFPKTWVLYKENQCKEFFEEFNSQKYLDLKEERKIVYIRKIGAGSHSAQGVEPVHEREEKELRRIYDNGTLCGKVTKNYIVQYFVHNPLLVHGHKFDFRVYCLVASSNPVIAYYHDGFMRVALQKYDKNAKDNSVFITNTALAKKAFHEADTKGSHEGMSKEELKDFHIWFMDDLQAYLLEAKVIEDKEWLDNYLRPEFKKAMVHLIRMSQAPFLKVSSLYELLGLDFMLDSDLNLWFIEANVFPALQANSPKEQVFFINMMTELFEITSELLKSRTKRIINFVNHLMEEKRATRVGDTVVFEDLEKARKEFEEITKNYFEPEFEPGNENTFAKIVDDNLDGTDRYMGLIDKECL